MADTFTGVAGVLDEASVTIQLGWTQGCSARHTDGLPVDVNHPYATSWCLTGAIRKAVSERRGGNRLLNSAMDYVRIVGGHAFASLGLSAWNDLAGRTRRQVYEVLVQARDLAAKEGK